MPSRQRISEHQVDGIIPTKPSSSLLRNSTSSIKLLHSMPVHTQITPSSFSKESHEQNYRGFLNLAVLLLACNTIRLVIENWIKYGPLITVPGKHIPIKDWYMTCAIVGVLVGHLLISLIAEKILIMHKNNVLALFLIFINIASILLMPPYMIWTHMCHPMMGIVILMSAMILCMKLISYHAVNAELRNLSMIINDKDDNLNPYPKISYPKNITFRNICYFWALPTLCYQPIYPTMPKFRKTFFIKRVIECLCGAFMGYFLIEQYAIPTVNNSLKPLNDLAWFFIFERILKLSLISLYIWLLGFYTINHSYFNALAELLSFGDRNFYDAWWNANTIEEYWRTWNMPVHLWLKRHIYFPLKSRGYSTDTAQFVIFLLSAIFHEYLIAVPTHIFKGWAFTAMMIQIPLVYVTRWYLAIFPGSSIGNFFFWITLCILGQPLCVLMYYRVWATVNNIS